MLKIKTKRLEKAISKYFEVKFKNNGYFLNTEEKDSICDIIIKYAVREGKSCAIMPGCVGLFTKTKHVWILGNKTDSGWRMVENLI